LPATGTVRRLQGNSNGMQVETVKIDPSRPETSFSRCKDVVSRGGVIVYPTDTFYALGADPMNAVAVQRLFEAKGRQGDQPILLLISDPDQVSKWAAEVMPEAERLMREHWPGPLTLVFRARHHVSPLLTAGRGTIGLRVPGNALTRSLLAFVGGALTGTSANISGGTNLRTAREAAAAFGHNIDLVLDGGETSGKKPSTIVDVSSGTPAVIRAGEISL
jgi:L-threonylcarbamoyladenylate synthase